MADAWGEAISRLSEPATKLVEKVSDAVGVVYEPTRMRRQARAEVDAARIRLEGEIDLGDVRRKALERLANEEVEKQINMSSITEKAFPYVWDTASPEDVDRDWLVRFFDRGRLISDEQVQETWARLLASEANEPGKFSLRAIDVLSSMSKRDAKELASFGSFCVDIGGIDVFESTYLTPLIYNINDPIYTTNGLTYHSLINLESLGIVKMSVGTLGQTSLSGLKQRGSIGYISEAFDVRIEAEGEPRLTVGIALLTDIGRELLTLVEAVHLPEFQAYFLEQLRKQNIYIEPVIKP